MDKKPLLITFIFCDETDMWPLEKYAHWDGNCWHQVDSDKGQLRLLVEVTINKTT
jgi:hypothetical protein